MTSQTAQAKLAEWVRTRAIAVHKEKLVSLVEIKPELGYWKFKNEEKARLVWRLNRYLRGKARSMGAYRVFVDALTGEIVEPDDPNIGANP